MKRAGRNAADWVYFQASKCVTHYTFCRARDALKMFRSASERQRACVVSYADEGSANVTRTHHRLVLRG